MNLEMLLAEAERDPWLFFKENRLRDIQKHCHPDKVGSDAMFVRFGTLHDKSLSDPVELNGYRLIEVLGVGELRTVHRAVSDAEPFVVKVPRVTSKSANNIIAKEREVTSQLSDAAKDTQYAFYYPRPVETFVIDKQRVNVFHHGDLKLYPTESIKRKWPAGISNRHIGWMFKRLLVGIGFAHRTGWCHNAVTPEHALVCPENHGIVLTGWIHSEKSDVPIKVVPAHRKDWYAEKKASFGQDIRMAAQLMAYLAREKTGRIASFIRGCQLEGGSQPTDAWELYDEFDDVLRRVYGAPRFVELKM